MSTFPLCNRCNGPAGAVLTFNYDEQQVWVDDLSDLTPIPPGIPLCETHAGRRTPPMGWTLTDLRQPERPLFVALESVA